MAGPPSDFNTNQLVVYVLLYRNQEKRPTPSATASPQPAVCRKGLVQGREKRPAATATWDWSPNNPNIEDRAYAAAEERRRQAEAEASRVRQQEEQKRREEAARLAREAKLAAEAKEAAELAEARKTARAAFIAANGVVAWASAQMLKTNPFPFKDKVVGVRANFSQMLSETEGAFGDLLVIDLPSTRFTMPGQQVVLAIRVLGIRTTKTPIGIELPFPYGSYVGVYLCRQNNCGDFFDPS